MADLAIDTSAIALVGALRPKAGATPGLDGKFRDEDVEVVVSVQMGARRPIGLLGADGKMQGAMVPVGEVTRPLVDFVRDGRLRLGGMEQREEAAEAVRQ